MAAKPPCPPFTLETATTKVKRAQALWNTKNPTEVVKAYTADTVWRNRDSFLQGTNAVEQFLTAKWAKEKCYVLRKELFCFSDNKIAVQFWYEWNTAEDGSGQWYRTYGLEDWTFDESGLMRKRMMSGNDVSITAEERWFTDGPENVEKAVITEKHW